MNNDAPPFPHDQFDSFEDRPFFDELVDRDAGEIRSLIAAALVRAAEIDDHLESVEVAGMFWGYVQSEMERASEGDPTAMRNIEIALAPITGGLQLQGVMRQELGDPPEGEGPAPNLPEFL